MRANPEYECVRGRKKDKDKQVKKEERERERERERGTQEVADRLRGQI